jgi:hypothetical protein
VGKSDSRPRSRSDRQRGAERGLRALLPRNGDLAPDQGIASVQAPHSPSLLAQELTDAGTLMGIDVVDHLILAGSRYFSLVESGRMRGRGGEPG